MGGLTAAQFIQPAVSLLAILALAWLAHGMRLGEDVRIRGEDHARDLAQEAVCDFDVADLVLDRAGIGALLRDTRGRVMLIKRHGAHFVARLLDTHADAQLDRNFLTIGNGERTFGRVTLDLGNKAQVWAGSLRRLGV